MTDRPGFTTALGRSIQVLRTDAGIDRRTLAGRASISYSYVAAIEAGNRHPSAAVLRRIAAALDLRSHELMAAAERRFDRILASVAPGPAIPTESSERAGILAELQRTLPLLDAEDLTAVLGVARRLVP